MRKKTSREVKVRIRRATAGDIDRVADWESEPSPAGTRQARFRAELSNALSRFYVAVDAATGELVGYTIFWIIGNLIEIHHISVKEGCRKSGIGGSLMKAILREARRESVEQLYLEVRKSNHDALAFYRKLGFRTCGLRKSYYRNPDEDALLMNKPL